MSLEDDLRNVVAALAMAHPESMNRLFAGWPLSKSETMMAFALMGLTSRLQPLQLNDSNAQQIVIDLAKKLGDMAVTASEKK